MRNYCTSSNVEKIALAKSKKELKYPPLEKIGIIEAESFPQLGMLVALRFIEWVLNNPGGVISLPTGKTPEMFIKWTTKILNNWDCKEIKELLNEYEVSANKKPEMKSLYFVQIDEFYPIDSSQINSFNYYVKDFYIKRFGLDPNKALLIDATFLGLPEKTNIVDIFPDNIVDLDLRVRRPKTDLERLQKETINRVDEFCSEYETKIRQMGGIGFFLGGIGPDGHIAFNVRGSSEYSVTRLTKTNYETQAAAASDLGGIEISRNRLVITIGLSTITYNPTTTAIIMAAGEAKTKIVRDAIELEKTQKHPATMLGVLPYSRFYITKGIASKLTHRKFIEFLNCQNISNEQKDEIIIDLSIGKNKPILELEESDFKSEPIAKELLNKTPETLSDLLSSSYNRIISKIENGLTHITKIVFLHTEPHQDDIMLSYLSYLYHLVRDPTNKHYFANLTSGFTSVSNSYFLKIVKKLKEYLETPTFLSLFSSKYFDPYDKVKKMEDIYLFLDGSAEDSQEKKDEAESRRLVRNIIDTYKTEDLKVIKLRVKELEEYLTTQYPGAKDPPDIQILKGSLREWESELLWAYFGIEASDVYPLRLPFYRGNIFSEEPEISKDVIPILNLLKKIKPNIVTVAFDPEASGPDTHYKAMQAVSEALKLYKQETNSNNIKVWGYRNVWYRFHPSEANIMVPVSLNTLYLLKSAFLNCFGSQAAASFPSYEHDGPFSELAQKIQVEQYRMIKTCLGKDFFLKNQHPRLRAARGMIFIKEMNLEEFFNRVRELKKVTEAI